MVKLKWSIWNKKQSDSSRKVYLTLKCDSLSEGIDVRSKYKKIEFEFKLPDGVNIEEIRKGIRRVILKCLKEEGLGEKELEKVRINIELVEEK